MFLTLFWELYVEWWTRQADFSNGAWFLENIGSGIETEYKHVK